MVQQLIFPAAILNTVILKSDYCFTGYFYNLIKYSILVLTA